MVNETYLFLWTKYITLYFGHPNVYLLRLAMKIATSIYVILQVGYASGHHWLLNFQIVTKMQQAEDL